jgi:uncharacterized phage protein gp47/JayE
MFLNVEKSDEQISADILSNLPDKYQKSVGFLAWDYARAIAIGGFNAIYEILRYICSMGDLNNFKYNDLVKFVYQRRGLIAREASKATGSLTVTGTGTIATGDLFQTEAGMQFEATETKTINGTGTIAIQAVVAGADGNVPVNSIVVIPVSIAGITSVTNPNALTGGYDAESKESIIERYLEDIRRPITSNNIYHYIKWAKEVVGVGDAKIKPLWNGDNTVKVVLINSDNECANTALVNAVQRYIDPFGYEVTNGTSTGYVQIYNDCSGSVDYVPQGTTVYSDKALTTILATADTNEFYYNSSTKYGWGCGLGEANIGAYVTVTSADAKNINISVEVDLKDGATLSEVEDAIEEKIGEYFKSTVFKDSYISYAKIGASILSADGVLDYDNLTVNSGTNNIPLVDTNASVEIAVLNSLTVTEGQ